MRFLVIVIVALYAITESIPTALGEEESSRAPPEDPVQPVVSKSLLTGSSSRPQSVPEKNRNTFVLIENEGLIKRLDTYGKRKTPGRVEIGNAYHGTIERVRIHEETDESGPGPTAGTSKIDPKWSLRAKSNIPPENTEPVINKLIPRMGDLKIDQSGGKQKGMNEAVPRMLQMPGNNAVGAQQNQNNNAVPQKAIGNNAAGAQQKQNNIAVPQKPTVGVQQKHNNVVEPQKPTGNNTVGAQKDQNHEMKPRSIDTTNQKGEIVGPKQKDGSVTHPEIPERNQLAGLRRPKKETASPHKERKFMQKDMDYEYGEPDY